MKFGRARQRCQRPLAAKGPPDDDKGEMTRIGFTHEGPEFCHLPEKGHFVRKSLVRSRHRLFPAASFAGEKDVGLHLPAHSKGVRPESRTPVLLSYLKHVAYFLAPRFS